MTANPWPLFSFQVTVQLLQEIGVTYYPSVLEDVHLLAHPDCENYLILLDWLSRYAV